MIEQLAWGLQITAVGMGLVFALLALLWGLLTLVLRFDPATVPAATAGADADDAPAAADVAGQVTDDVAAEPSVGASTAGAASAAGLPDQPVGEGDGRPAPGAGIDPDLLAAITVAVVTHRALRRRQAAPAMRSYWPGSLLYASRWVGTGRARQNFYWRRRGR